MFIFTKWDRFCKFISESELKCIRADEILFQKPESNWVVIKHDVETDVRKALQMAKIESKYGVPATYYVQSYLLTSNSKILIEIQDLGHEVTYHYDVLDANNGDYEKATKEFLITKQSFELLGFKINTVCPHGNPIMIRDGWDSNKDFFKNNDVQKYFPDIFDIVVNSKSKIPFGFIYISDAGYGWKKVGNIYDNDKKNTSDVDLKSIEDMRAELNKESRYIISCHPHRWSENYFLALFHLTFFKVVRFMAKYLARFRILKKIMSKFYYLAKKI